MLRLKPALSQTPPSTVSQAPNVISQFWLIINTALSQFWLIIDTAINQQ